MRHVVCVYFKSKAKILYYCTLTLLGIAHVTMYAILYSGPLKKIPIFKLISIFHFLSLILFLIFNSCLGERIYLEEFSKICFFQNSFSWFIDGGSVGDLYYSDGDEHFSEEIIVTENYMLLLPFGRFNSMVQMFLHFLFQLFLFYSLYSHISLGDTFALFFTSGKVLSHGQDTFLTVKTHFSSNITRRSFGKNFFSFFCLEDKR